MYKCINVRRIHMHMCVYGARGIPSNHFLAPFLYGWCRWSFADRALFSDQEQFDLLYKFCEDKWATPASLHVSDKQVSDSGSHGNGQIEANFKLLFDGMQPFDVRKFVVILPPDALNSDPPAMTQQRSNNQLLHLMGEHTAFRRKVFETGLLELCRFINIQKQERDHDKTQARLGEVGPDDEGHPRGQCGSPERLEIVSPVRTGGQINILTPQLGLNRANLLQWTLDSYGKEAENALDSYANGAQHGKFSVSESRHLANAVHHYAHALVAKGGREQYAKAVEMRQRVWELLQENLAGRRRAVAAASAFHSGGGSNSSQGKTPVESDWPELLKVTAEAGQQLVSINGIATELRVAIAADVSAILEQILQVCHPAQQPAVQHMVAHMHAERGLLYLQQSQGVESLIYFHKSLALYRQLSEKSGTHILVQPLTALANLLCTLKYFTRAFPLYEEAIRIAESNLGSRHYSLSNHYLNFGIGKIEQGNMIEGAVLLRKVMHLCLIGMNTREFDGENSEVCNKAEYYLGIAMPNRDDRTMGI